MKLLLSALLAFSATAYAADPPPSTPPADANPQVAGTPAKPAHPDCLTQTGSRIKHKEGECISRSGKVITREDMQRTGELNQADALRKLDPSMH